MPYFEEEDIGTLHARVEDLGSGEVVRFIATHDLGTSESTVY